MVDISSLDGMPNEEPNAIQKLFNMEWSDEHENILVDWADKAMCYRWLHAQATRKFSKLARLFTIPVIIISTLTGTANFAQDRVPADFVSYFVMMVGALNLIAGIISTIQQFLKINELNESHRVSSIAWDKFYRNIKIELAKKPSERIPVGQMIKLCKEEFDRLMETSPIIQTDIIRMFNETFKDQSSFIDIKKPEICDELTSTQAFRYVAKAVDPITKHKAKVAFKKAREYDRSMRNIREFSSKFMNAQGRQPTKDEIMELSTTDEQFGSIDKEIFEKSVNAYFDLDTPAGTATPESILKSFTATSVATVSKNISDTNRKI
jgi:hypothetical protein